MVYQGWVWLAQLCLETTGVVSRLSEAVRDPSTSPAKGEELAHDAQQQVQPILLPCPGEGLAARLDATVANARGLMR
eukprot:9469622-Pyramimonas_sp.AAC.1